MRAPGLRRRLVLSLVAVVALTVAVVGPVSVILVDRSLRNGLVSEAVAATEFNVAVLVPAAGIEADAGAGAIETSGILDRFLGRGVDGAWVEIDGATVSAGVGALVASPGLTNLARAGDIAFEFVDSGRGPVLVTAAQLPPDGPVFYFARSARTIEDATRQVLGVVTAAGLVAIAAGALVASALARRMLRPVAAAGEAAELIADGRLDVRLTEEGSDELGHLSAAFNRMAGSLQHTIEELESARSREKRFVADVSHELRTPLTGLVNEARMLSDRLTTQDAVTEDHRKLARMMDDDVGRIRSLVDDLLEISRLDSDAVDTGQTVVDVEIVLGALIEARHPAAELRTTLDGPLVVDRLGLERIVGNLLDNARIHAPGAETTVEAGVGDGTLEIEVSDRGPGVDPSALTTIFHRFSTADPSRGSGTGLGLAIAAQHAQRLGGSLTAGLRPGGGMTMRARIPVGELLHGGDLTEKSSPHSEATEPKGDTP